MAKIYILYFFILTFGAFANESTINDKVKFDTTLYQKELKESLKFHRKQLFKYYKDEYGCKSFSLKLASIGSGIVSREALVQLELECDKLQDLFIEDFKVLDSKYGDFISKVTLTNKIHEKKESVVTAFKTISLFEVEKGKENMKDIQDSIANYLKKIGCVDVKSSVTLKKEDWIYDDMKATISAVCKGILEISFISVEKNNILFYKRSSNESKGQRVSVQFR